MKILTSFHNKVLRGILKLSPRSPVAPLYFLLGELPVEAQLHLDVLTLFRGVWANPQTKIFDIIKYLLMMTNSSSHTWSAHLRSLFQLYHLPDPLMLLNSPVWSKEKWRILTKTAVAKHFETTWRNKAAANHKLRFLNVQTIGLLGNPHPVLGGILSTQEAMRARVHVKMLSGDYPCSYFIFKDRGQDPSCLLCRHLQNQAPTPIEDMVHLLTRCRATADTRTRVLADFFNTLYVYFPHNQILDYPNHEHLTQLILDPTSLNLPLTIRISPDHPALQCMLAVTRTICFAIHKDRTRQLKLLKH